MKAQKSWSWTRKRKYVNITYWHIILIPFATNYYTVRQIDTENPLLCDNSSQTQFILCPCPSTGTGIAIYLVPVLVCSCPFSYFWYYGRCKLDQHSSLWGSGTNFACRSRTGACSKYEQSSTSTVKRAQAHGHGQSIIQALLKHNTLKRKKWVLKQMSLYI